MTRQASAILDMWRDVVGAFAFLTIFPLYLEPQRKPGYSVLYYPLVGLVIGLLLAGIALLDIFSPLGTAFLVVLAWVVITGGLHLDGWADSCDALFATVTPERRLEIMRDPRVGAWAAIGVGLILLGKWSFIPSVEPIQLLLPPIVGRWVMVIAIVAWPYARLSGLGRYFGEDATWTGVVLGGVFTIGVSVVLAPLVLAVVPLVLLLGAWAAQRLGGGLTGDSYGGLCEVTELLCLIVLSV